MSVLCIINKANKEVLQKLFQLLHRHPVVYGFTVHPETLPRSLYGELLHCQQH